MSTKVAVVTGSNSGIGFAIIRGLCKRFDGIVYLTSLYQHQGEEAVAILNKEGIYPKYHHLDISDPESVTKFRDHIRDNYGYIDVFINNAAIAFKVNSPESAAVQAETTVGVNYFATLLSTEILYPILRNGARVIYIASDRGHLSNIPSERIRKRLQDPSLSTADLSDMMREYVDAVKQGTHVAEWGDSAYAVSKVATVALAMIHHRQLKDRDIKVNAVHPGYVKTDMALNMGRLTPDEGARVPLYLALDAPDSLRGAYFWHDKSIITWDGELPANPYGVPEK